MSYWTQTHVGLKRSTNEDALLVNAEIGLFGVADGMGGHAAGEVASADAVRIISQSLSEYRELIARFADPLDQETRTSLSAVLRRAVVSANEAIHKLMGTTKRSRVGTTFCGALLNDRQALIANVGDSRAYLSRAGQMYQLTQDHTVIAEQLRRGMITAEQAATSPFRNILMRAVGLEPIVDADIIPVELCHGDRLLFCSDGLHGQVGWQEIAEMMIEKDGERGVAHMVEQSNRAGGIDNVTVVLVELDGSDQGVGAEHRSDHLIDPQAKIHTMWKLPLFQSLDYAELMKLMAVTNTRTYRAGQVIFAEHDDGDEFLVVLDGELAVVIGGRQLATIPSGQYVGELALLDGSPRSATVLAHADTKVLAIKREDFYPLMRRETALASKLLWHFGAHMAEVIRELNSRLRQ